MCTGWSDVSTKRGSSGSAPCHLIPRKPKRNASAESLTSDWMWFWPKRPAKMIEAFAPAKVNLTLHVTGQRDDGYHLLDSLVVFTDCGDRLVIEEANELSLTVTGPYAKNLGDDPDNLILRAARMLSGTKGARITLEKNLPIASGVGGGSSDAAAALR